MPWKCGVFVGEKGLRTPPPRCWRPPRITPRRPCPCTSCCAGYPQLTHFQPPTDTFPRPQEAVRRKQAQVWRDLAGHLPGWDASLPGPGRETLLARWQAGFPRWQACAFQTRCVPLRAPPLPGGGDTERCSAALSTARQSTRGSTPVGMPCWPSRPAGLPASPLLCRCSRLCF